tara:strand:+ start:43 stop:852 length:810 start_codon:yes stop_codon:yes gene_type:complete
MKVITIANYPKDDNYYRMFLAWVVHNYNYMPECEVQICYAGDRKNMIFSDECQELLRQFDNITFKELKPTPFPIPKSRISMVPFVRNYMMSVWYEKAPYVYIDTDLYLFKPLKEFYKYLDNAPFVGTGHGGYSRKQEKHLNGGFYGVGDDNFFDVDILYKHMITKFPEGSSGSTPSNISWRQQHSINEWMEYKQYNPFVFDDNHFWNWYGRLCKFSKNSDNSYKVLNEKNEEVYGAHFFGGKKPWRCPNASENFWQPTMQKIRDMGMEV